MGGELDPSKLDPRKKDPETLTAVEIAWLDTQPPVLTLQEILDEIEGRESDSAELSSDQEAALTRDF